MNCDVCGKNLDQPGDYCLNCGTQNCEAVYVATEDNNADITFITSDKLLGTIKLDWRKNDNDKMQKTVERNFVGRIVDVVRRKKPDFLYVNSQPKRIRSIRSYFGDLDIFVFEPDSDPISEIQTHISTRGLETVDKDPKDKLGGSHTTVIGDRNGQSVITSVASCPFVKKVIPGPIDGGGNSGGGFRAEVTRAGSSGNIRVLIKEGGTVQTIRVVTTAPDRESAEVVMKRVQELI